MEVLILIDFSDSGSAEGTKTMSGQNGLTVAGAAESILDAGRMTP